MEEMRQSVEEMSKSMQANFQSTQDMPQCHIEALMEASRVTEQGHGAATAVHSDGRDQAA